MTRRAPRALMARFELLPAAPRDAFRIDVEDDTFALYEGQRWIADFHSRGAAEAARATERRRAARAS